MFSRSRAEGSQPVRVRKDVTGRRKEHRYDAWGQHSPVHTGLSDGSFRTQQWVVTFEEQERNIHTLLAP